MTWRSFAARSPSSSPRIKLKMTGPSMLVPARLRFQVQLERDKPEQQRDQMDTGHQAGRPATKMARNPMK